MPFEIKPRRGLKGLSFDSSKDEARSFFGSDFSFGQRGEGSRLHDYWPEVPVFAYYDEHDRLEALEFASDANVFLDGIRLFDLRANQAIQFLRQRDAHLRLEQDGATSKELCLGLWIPDAFEPEAAVESVILFRDGYYST
jgi:hypothetical protein